MYDNPVAYTCVNRLCRSRRMDNKGIPPPPYELEVQAVSEEKPSVKQLFMDYMRTVQGVAKIFQTVGVYTSVSNKQILNPAQSRTTKLSKWK